MGGCLSTHGRLHKVKGSFEQQALTRNAERHVFNNSSPERSSSYLYGTKTKATHRTTGNSAKRAPSYDLLQKEILDNVKEKVCKDFQTKWVHEIIGTSLADIIAKQAVKEVEPQLNQLITNQCAQAAYQVLFDGAKAQNSDEIYEFIDGQEYPTERKTVLDRTWLRQPKITANQGVAAYKDLCQAAEKDVLDELSKELKKEHIKEQWRRKTNQALGTAEKR
ncbi:hypothetical protein F5Y16DRAFT_404585 [Xylariaceae sp. FL0255]|nr:hypothetical protein F5Y16DRAFT_404585 [Xylariaceae sp. FL0255]